jgi:hypothetical protein
VGGLDQAQGGNLVKVVRLHAATAEAHGDAVGDAEVEFDRLIQERLAEVRIGGGCAPAEQGSGLVVSPVGRIGLLPGGGADRVHLF